MDLLPEDIDDQRAWSDATFGPGPRLTGVLDHLSKEIEEVRESPDDLSEWVDLLVLVLDGATRQGFNGWRIIKGYHDKMQVNAQREWPDWRTADPDKAIEHVRAE